MRVLKRFGLVLATVTSVVVFSAQSAFAVVTLVQISQDTFTNATSQHRTQVEPDSFSFGSTIVSVVQTGRFFDGGASDIAFATSLNNGTTWTTGNLPGITTFAGGIYDRVSDPAVAYDAQDNVWLVSTLALTEAGGVSGAAVLTSRSTDGGLTWGNPVTTATGGDVDKNWIACDNSASSPFYGNCYTQWDVFSLGDRIRMSTSTDGGLTWGAAKSPKANPAGLGGQPVVQPNGTVIVPVANASETAVGAFRSTDGGGSWSKVTTISSVPSHTVAGGLRSGPLPTAEIDGAGKVFVAWQDCRFRSGCTANDIVYSTSTNGTSWSAVTRIPIDATTSGVDHFIPGLAVDKTTSGGSAHLALTYYYYPATSCTFATCQLNVGFISSTNGGSTWSAPTQLAGPMQLAWIADTSQGRMVGDYISTSYASDGLAHPLFTVGKDPTGTGFAFDEALYTTSTGLALTAGINSGEIWPGASPPTAPGADNRHYRHS
jgi:BNR repeat-like domain